MGVDRIRSTKIAPVALSTSYLTGSASLGISTMTLISSGGFVPVGTRSRPMVVSSAAPARGGGRAVRGGGKGAHSTRRASGPQKKPRRSALQTFYPSRFQGPYPKAIRANAAVSAVATHLIDP